MKETLAQASTLADQWRVIMAGIPGRLLWSGSLLSRRTVERCRFDLANAAGCVPRRPALASWKRNRRDLTQECIKRARKVALSPDDGRDDDRRATNAERMDLLRGADLERFGVKDARYVFSLEEVDN